jgi:hypothetical protein
MDGTAYVTLDGLHAAEYATLEDLLKDYSADDFTVTKLS